MLQDTIKLIPTAILKSDAEFNGDVVNGSKIKLVTTTANPYIDFLSNGSTAQYDARINVTSQWMEVLGPSLYTAGCSVGSLVLNDGTKNSTDVKLYRSNTGELVLQFDGTDTVTIDSVGGSASLTASTGYFDFITTAVRVVSGTNNTVVQNNGIKINSDNINPFIELRNTGTTASTPYIDFTGNSSTKDFDTRIISRTDPNYGETLEIAGFDGTTTNTLRIHTRDTTDTSGLTITTSTDLLRFDVTRINVHGTNKHTGIDVRVDNDTLTPYIDLSKDSTIDFDWRIQLHAVSTTRRDLEFIVQPNGQNEGITIRDAARTKLFHVKPLGQEFGLYDQAAGYNIRIYATPTITYFQNLRNDLSEMTYMFGDAKKRETLDVKTNANLGLAEIRVYGAGQSDALMYIGQSVNYGGGIVYKGDTSSDLFGLAGSGSYVEWNTEPAVDTVAFYRRTANVNYPVFWYVHNSNDVHFAGKLYDRTNNLTGGEQHNTYATFRQVTSAFHVNKTITNTSTTAYVAGEEHTAFVPAGYKLYIKRYAVVGSRFLYLRIYDPVNAAVIQDLNFDGTTSTINDDYNAVAYDNSAGTTSKIVTIIPNFKRYNSTAPSDCRMDFAFVIGI